MHIYFVRHGETRLNKEMVYYGDLDEPLTDMGCRQAERVRTYLSHVEFDRVYVSNKIRTIQTAEIICASVPKNHVFVIPEFSELNFGCFEGLSNAQVQRKFPEIYKAWCDDWLNFPLPGGECFNDFFLRVKAAFQHLLGQCSRLSAEKNILICVHNGTLRVLFAIMCGLTPDGTWHFNFKQDAYSRVDYEWENFTIQTINCKNME